MKGFMAYDPKSSCDSCIGRGDDPNCMCGGSGLAIDAVIQLRKNVIELSMYLDTAEYRISELELQVKVLENDLEEALQSNAIKD